VDFSTFRVSNLEDFEDKLTNLREKYGDHTILYRGQTSDRPLVPSSKRPLLDDDSITAYPIINIFWEQCIEGILDDYYNIPFNSQKEYILAGMGLLQHYGHRSWFVDVTQNPHVALWFALNKFLGPYVKLKQSSCYGSDGNLSSFLVDHALATIYEVKYERVCRNNGYLYVIGLSNNDTDLLIDLKKYVPLDVSPRIHRQSAYGLLEPDDKRSLESLILAKFIIDSSIEDPLDVTFESLFPSPRQDKVYQTLIGLPHIVRTKDIRRKQYIGRQMIQIPIYNTNNRTIGDIAEYTRILLFEGLFPHGLKFYTISDPESFQEDFSGKLQNLLDAACVKLPICISPKYDPIFIPKTFDEQSTSDNQIQMKKTKSIYDCSALHEIPHFENIWPSDNIFFENSFLVTDNLNTPEEEVVRGHWVLWSEKEVYICQVYDNFRYLGSKLGCHFQYTNNKWELIRKETDCQKQDDKVHIAQLVQFLLWSAALVGNDARLQVINNRLFHFNWNNSPFQPKI